MRQSALLLAVLVISIANIQPSFAHKLKASTDVGATLHMEPNDNPRAGEPAKTWFALTRKGGETIPLKDCDCKLVVYAEPHTPGEPPLIEPSLKPVAIERYKGIPGTEITFPKLGSYQLHLSGKPSSGKTFQPFELKFDITVATGTASITAPAPQANQDITTAINNGVAQEESKGFPIWAIAIPIVAGVGISAFLLQRKKG
jgi:hypothetical protein